VRTLQAEGGLQKRDDLSEVTATLVQLQQPGELLLKTRSVTEILAVRKGAYRMHDNVKTTDLRLTTAISIQIAEEG
jgi:hypothetical protein